MKQLFIYILLFFLVISAATFLDILQGLSVMDTLHIFLILKQKLTGEDWMLICLFFLPLIFSLSNNFLKKNHSSNPTFEE
ncbi:hypothetical protein COJ85_32395 [Bacillus sp. AFS076308]|nr:hypothetical protein COJ85_32395 [Bacillus sp. AFS076308]PGV49112.1 hypothetical protein COD92_23075 [Bacillus sp. AFS037270]